MKWPVIEERDPAEQSEPGRRADPDGTYPLVRPQEVHALPLRQRIATTVKAAQAHKALELKQATDRAKAERQAMVDKAKAAILSVLSDDTLDLIIGKHAALGELNTGAIKITKSGVELLRSAGAGASHQVGDRLDVGFDGGILQAGQQLRSYEVEARVSELLSQGIKIETIHDTSTQSLVVSFDYGMALS